MVEDGTQGFIQRPLDLYIKQINPEVLISIPQNNWWN